jgi:hypothetical protein
MKGRQRGIRPADRDRSFSSLTTGMWLLSPMTMSSCLQSWARSDERRRRRP